MIKVGQSNSPKKVSMGEMGVFIEWNYILADSMDLMGMELTSYKTQNLCNCYIILKVFTAKATAYMYIVIASII